MYSHLVSIEVGVERCTYEWMKFDCLTLYKDWLEGLDSKSVECRSSVKHNRMLFDDVLKDIPYLRLKSLNHLLCTLYVVCGSVSGKLLHNEWFEKLDSHLLRKTTLINLKLWLYADNRTA